MIDGIIKNINFVSGLRELHEGNEQSCSTHLLLLYVWYNCPIKKADEKYILKE